MKTIVIIPAAGRGLRLKSKIHKPFLKIAGQQLVFRTLLKFERHKSISGIIIAVSKDKLKKVSYKLKKSRFKKIISVVCGGATRTESVKNALGAIPADADLVLIHDVARPFVSDKIIADAISAARVYGAAITGIPVKATLKSFKDGFFVDKTLDRKSIYEIQTPQVFKKNILLEAYKKLSGISFTDDSQLVEKLGFKVKIVNGSYFNIKITTPEDIIFAEAIAKIQK